MIRSRYLARELLILSLIAAIVPLVAIIALHQGHMQVAERERALTDTQLEELIGSEALTAGVAGLAYSLDALGAAATTEAVAAREADALDSVRAIQGAALLEDQAEIQANMATLRERIRALAGSLAMRADARARLLKHVEDGRALAVRAESACEDRIRAIPLTEGRLPERLVMMEMQSELHEIERTLRVIPTTADLDHDLGFLKLAIRAATRRLIDVADQPLRAKLARSLMGLARLTDQGVRAGGSPLSLRRDELEAEVDIAGARAELDTDVGALSQAIGGLIGARATRAVGAASRTLDSGIRVRQFVLWGGVLVVALVFAIVWWFLRVRLIRPFRWLTAAVLDAAHGRTTDGGTAASHPAIGSEELVSLAAAVDALTETNRALVESEASFRRVNEDLERFIYHASHDLKAPLRAISTISALLVEGADDLPHSQDYYLAMIGARARRLGALIDDLLTFARSGRSGPWERLSLRELVDDCVEVLALPESVSVSVAANANADADAGGDGGIHVHAPRTWLEAIVRNLVQNAHKHHPEPDRARITIGAHVERQRQLLEVSDDGGGIPPDQQEQIFEMFRTLRSRDVVEGSGMGLAIVRRMARSMGGEIELAASSEAGSTFRLRWPGSPPGADADAASVPSDAAVGGAAEDGANAAPRT